MRLISHCILLFGGLCLAAVGIVGDWLHARYLRLIVAALLCATAMAVEIPITWKIHPEAIGVRVDVHSGTNLVESHTYTPAGSGASLDLAAGDYRVTAWALGETLWTTNEQTGDIWATNAVLDAVDSNPARILILPPLEMEVFSQPVTGQLVVVPVIGPVVDPPPIPPTPTNAVLSFLPTDDAYLQGTARFNDNSLKVEAGKRVSYLKFSVAGISGRVTKATLSLQESGDIGSGTLRVYRGSHSNWTENNLSTSNRPTEQGQVGTFTGSVANAQVVNINVTPLVTGNGTYSVILKQDAGGNDVWFGSKESTRKPKLVVETTNP